MSARKVLMLHGYSQNATIFSKRMEAIRKLCGNDIDFVFVDAPHVLFPVDIDTSSSLQALDVQDVSTSINTTNPVEKPRTWWWWKEEDKTHYYGIDDTLIMLRDIMKEDRFEGVFGFSQGACLAALLSALLEKPHLYPPFLIDGNPPHPPMKFCVAVSGFKVKDLTFGHIMDSYTTPTLHVIGRNDVIVVSEHSQTLVDASENKRVEYHDGGHFIPSNTNWRKFFCEYLLDPLGNVPSPGGEMVGNGLSESFSGNSIVTETVIPGEATVQISRL